MTNIFFPRGLRWVEEIKRAARLIRRHYTYTIHSTYYYIKHVSHVPQTRPYIWLTFCIILPIISRQTDAYPINMTTGGQPLYYGKLEQ